MSSVCNINSVRLNVWLWCEKCWRVHSRRSQAKERCELVWCGERGTRGIRSTGSRVLLCVSTVMLCNFTIKKKTLKKNHYSTVSLPFILFEPQLNHRGRDPRVKIIEQDEEVRTWFILDDVIKLWPLNLNNSSLIFKLLSRWREAVFPLWHLLAISFFHFNSFSRVKGRSWGSGGRGH